MVYALQHNCHFSDTVTMDKLLNLHELFPLVKQG